MTPQTTTIQLTWYDPRSETKQELLTNLPVTIGRTDDNTIQLKSKFISNEHVRLEDDNGRIVIHDLGSKNGTMINGKPIQQAVPLPRNRQFQIGPFGFKVELFGQQESVTHTATHLNFAAPHHPHTSTASVLTFSPVTDVLSPPPIFAPTLQNFPPAIFRQQVVPIHRLEQMMPVETTTYLSVGGGIGSFVWADHLVVYGADPQEIVSIGFEPKPYSRYRRLCQNSQIPDHERLRSNSDSCPDNLWGWPGYGVREMWQEATRGNVKQAVQVGWKLFNEPLVETYTPRADMVYAGMDREAKRIGWERIWRQGRVRAIRKTDDGHYVVAYSQMQDGEPSQHRLIVCQYLHLAVGYPGVRFLPDLQAYRERTGDFVRVVNAYEEHDYVYEDLQKQGGIVLIRGRGIVASRLIQRLYEIRTQYNVPIGVLHLMRTPLAEGYQYGNAQRDVNNHWEFQPFNWPKAAWGGDLRVKLEQADTQERGQLLDAWGGTTTADRVDWRKMIEQGIREGWYEIHFGTVDSVQPHESGRLATILQGHGVVERQVELLADYIVDATGLDSAIDSNALLKDLVTHYRLPRNAKGRLKVSNTFDLEPLRTEQGRMYASGITTLGGPYAAVDSFLGLQYAALRSVDDLVSQGAPGLRRLNGWRSLRQWARWAKGVTP